MATMNENGFLTFKTLSGKFQSINMKNVAEVKFDDIYLEFHPYENILIAFFNEKQEVFKMLCFGFPCGDDTIEIGFNEAYSIQKMFGVNILKGYD
jgi:hypothetical protein